MLIAGKAVQGIVGGSDWHGALLTNDGIFNGCFMTLSQLRVPRADCVSRSELDWQKTSWTSELGRGIIPRLRNEPKTAWRGQGD